MDDAPRISVEELKRRLDEGDDVVILDVRKGSWYRSDVKIPGAVRIDLDELAQPDGKLAPETPTVTYCT